MIMFHMEVTTAFKYYCTEHAQELLKSLEESDKNYVIVDINNEETADDLFETYSCEQNRCHKASSHMMNIKESDID